jgi:ATP-dependent helicase/nuclease subunit B
MTPEEIDLLRDFAGEKAADLGRSIMAGDIRKNPCTFKDRDSCTFCQFKAVCEFEQRLPGCEKRQLEEPQRDRLWEMIRQTVEKHSEDDGD